MSTKTISDKKKRYLRSMAHTLKPVVIIGNAGLTDAVLREIELSLAHHELIKIRVHAADRDDRKQMIGNICNQCGAALVQSIGHIAAIYRPADKPKIQFP